MSLFKSRAFALLALFSACNLGCMLETRVTSLRSKDLALPIVRFSLASSSAAENSSLAAVEVTLSAATDEEITVPITLAGTATASADYSVATTSINILAGQTTAYIPINLIDDSNYEGPETILITLGMPTGTATLGSHDTHVFTIAENDAAAISISVAKVYPVNGAKFLDYIANSDISKSRHSQADVACVGTETGYYGCIHAGEKLKVHVTGYASCAGLSASDLLGAFDWVCEEVSGVATFFTTGLKHGKGLSDLIDFSVPGFLDNSLTVRNGVTVLGATIPAKWWSNTIQNLDVTPGVKTISGLAAGTILALGTNANTEGVNLAQSKVGLVIKRGQSLGYAGSGSNCNWRDGTTVSPDWQCIVAAGNQKHIWIEGEIRPAGQNILSLDMSSVTFSRIQNVTINDTFGDAFYILGGGKNIIKSVKMHTYKNRDYALLWLTGNENLISDVHIANETETNYHNTFLVEGSRNVLNDVRTNRTIGGIGIGGWDGGARDNVVSNAQSIHSGALFVSGVNNPTTGNTIHHVTVAYNYTDCIALANVMVSGNVVNQALCSNTYTQIWMDSNSSNSTLSQIAIDTNNGINAAVTMDTVNNNKFTNNMLVAGASLNCDVTAGTNPGLADGCVNQGSSDAVWTLLGSTNLYPSMVGLLTAGDTVNTSDTGAAVSYVQILDWLNFENIFRSWSTSNLNDTTQCSLGSCQVFDARLKSTDTLVLNKSGNGVSPNGAFVAGATCPSAVHGNRALTDAATSPRTFLINATEIFDDDIGNDNGLCESSEACLYSPNFGAYQGEGNYKTNGTCIFQNGNVQDVIMYAYPINGI